MIQGLIDTLRRYQAAPVVVNGPITADLWQHHRASGGCDGLPPHLRRVVNQLDRYFAASDKHLTPAKRAEIEASIYVELSDRAARRDAEQQLAAYIHTVADALPGFELRYNAHALADRLAECRTQGVAGQTADGRLQVAWDAKCDQVRLCPDESRVETQRIARRYCSAMRDWVGERPGRRRVIYAVLTCPNFEAGRLDHGKRYTLAKFKNWMRFQYDAAPLAYRRTTETTAPGVRRVVHKAVKTRKRKLAAFPSLRGALVVQEDPLSARQDWNVHLNAFLLVDGRFDYKEAREVWGHNVEFRELDATDPETLYHAALEAVKYSAQIVPTKSAEKRAKRATHAPAMVEWTPRQWAEWWAAQQGFRRVRSYGCLYKIGKPADTEPPMVTWLGRVTFHRGRYRVDLIPGNNFSDWGRHRAADIPTNHHPPPLIGDCYENRAIH